MIVYKCHIFERDPAPYVNEALYYDLFNVDGHSYTIISRITNVWKYSNLTVRETKLV